MARVLLISSNIGGTNVVLPVAKLALERGHEITVCAGGRGLKRWQDSGMPISVVGQNELTARPQGFDPYAILRSQKIELVIAGQSSPMDWESDMLLASLFEEVKAFSIGDFWNGWTRLKVGPLGGVGLLDVFDVNKLRKDSTWNKSVGVVTGNPGAVQVSVPDEIRQAFDELRQKHGRVYLYAMGGPDTALEELQLVVDSMIKTPQGVLVPRGNPKYNKPGLSEADQIFKQRWEEILDPLRKSGRVAEVPSPAGEPLAAASDVTISGFSTMSTITLCHGGAAISLCIPGVLASLKKQSGLDEIPHVVMGLSTSLAQPGDLSGIKAPSAEQLSQLMPYDPARALEGALNLLG